MSQTPDVTILNVDDYAVSREGVSELLRSAGFHVIEAGTGQEALRAAAAAQPQLILLDVKLPDLSGYEVCQRLRADPATAPIPVLLVSGVFAEGSDKVHGLEIGADGYLIKPVAPAELIATVRALLRMQRAEEDLRRSRAELADFFENAPVGLHWVGGDGTILWTNQAELDLLGYPGDEYIGHNIREFHADQEVVEDILRRLKSGETLHSYEARLRAKDGSIRWVLVSSNVLWKDGEFIHTRCITRDITPRKQAEEARLASEKRFRSIFECNMVPMGIWTKDGGVTEANDALLELTGYTRDELRAGAINWIELTPPEYRQLDEQALAETRARGVCASYEKEYVRRDGRRVPVLIGGAAFENDPDSGIFFVVDLSDRKQAESLLRESERRFRVMADTAPVLIWMAGPDSLCNYFNKAWLDFTGRTIDEETGHGWTKGIHPDDYDRCLQTWLSAFDERRSFSMEYRLRRHDGTYRWVLDHGVPRFNADGSLAGYIGSCIDIHERRQAEEALRASEEFNRSVLESSADCIKVLDLDGRLLSMNAPGLAMMEIEDFSVCVGRPWLEFWGESHRPLVREALAAAVRGGIGRFTAPCRTVRGAVKWWEVVISPVPDQDGQPERLVAISRDITERRQLEEERSRLYQSEQMARVRAEEASRMKDEFLAIVSHELRAPLNAIQGWVKLLREGRLTQEEAARALETIERSAWSQNRIISDLLDVSRVITGKLRLNVRPLDPARIIESSLESVRPAAEARDVRLEKILDYGAGPISGDSDRLQQIVWNLLSNAIKFTPRGGRVQVRLERVNSSIEIIVSDTGAGIKPELLPYVFDRFRQGDSSSTRRFGGLGLGLAIVRHLTEMHGGTVRAESRGEGQGATFIVRLPVLITHQNAGEKESVHPAAEDQVQSLDCPPELDDLRVLVVDDDRDARDLVKTILAQCGAEVRTAGSAAEALAIFTGSPPWQPELLISDIEMPDKDGYDFLHDVRLLKPEQGGRVPAIALTAYARVEDRLRALAAGFQMHVAKPVETAELLTVAASLTGRLARAKQQSAPHHAPEMAMGEGQGA